MGGTGTRWGIPINIPSVLLAPSHFLCLPPHRGHSLEWDLHCGCHRQGQAHSQLAPIRDSMRSRRLWRSRWTMKSSSDRMRKEEMQLTIRRIPLAMESNRLLPSGTRGGRKPAVFRKGESDPPGT